MLEKTPFFLYTIPLVSSVRPLFLYYIIPHIYIRRSPAYQVKIFSSDFIVDANHKITNKYMNSFIVRIEEFIKELERSNKNAL